MSLSSAATLSPASRSLAWLVGPDALLSTTALSTGQLASLGPIASIIEGAVDVGSADTSGSPLPDAVSATANQVVLDTHAQLEVLGHEVAPLNGPLHGLTNLGETVGLGHIGEAGNLVTDLTGVVADPAGSAAIPSLLSDTGSVATAAGTLLESVTAVPASGNGLVGTGGILSPATSILNQAVLDVHTTLEDVGHQIPVLNAPIHAVTGLNETVGLGHIGEAGNLLTDTLALPGSLLTGGGLASASPVLSDLGHVLGSADTLVGSVTGVANAGGLLSSDGLLAPVTNLANTAVLDLHATLENLGHGVPLLNDALHGLTNLGETIGLGYLGQGGNLLTDVAALPGDLLGGQGLGALSPILNDVGAVTHAAGGLLGGVTGILGGLGGDASAPGGSLLAPVTSTVDGLLGGHGDGALPLDGLLGGATGLLGGLGGGGGGSPASGLLAPVTSTVDGLLGGHGGTPLDGLLGGLTGGGQADGIGGPLLGANAPLQPVAALANGVIDGIHATLEQVGHDVPVLNDPLHAVINLGTTVGLGELGESSNLVTDVVNLPGAVLSGNAGPAIGQVVGDVGHVADAAGGVLGSVTGALSGAAGGGQGTGSPLDGVLGTVTSVLGGSDAGNPVGGLPGGLTGGGSGEGGTGTHPLIDVAAGPTTATPLANAAVLTPAADPSHTVQASAIAVGADQPSLATANLLSGDSILLPQSSGSGGADSIVGQILSPASAAPAGAGEAGGSHGASPDLGIVTIDLGSHADVHHTDPTPHSATGGLHLLGL
ncbi:hypothetical protein MKL09_21175 [Methylobacterium sp. J-048]|uniref:hypothetical protein n=1 Tax=Methylobacterium sp. J-048 TaxID=2836635 RepID=UPI001FBAFA27|nr:hypothetical protein [Methylobacterium sp. J-048]MCJ2059040.1 hypothetical protein [Methylobacterium sp. J-048]